MLKGVHAQLFPKLPKFKATPPSDLYASLGYGVNYGYNSLGVNLELSYNYFGFSGGIGYYIGEGSSFVYQVTLRGYFLPLEKRVRPRLGINYGVSGIFVEGGSKHISHGLNVSAGVRHKFYESFFYEMDFHVFFPATFTYRPESARIKTTLFSFGLGMVIFSRR